MDKSKIEDAKKKLKEINDILTDYHPEIRAGAFEILARQYFDNGSIGAKRKLDSGGQGGVCGGAQRGNMEDFLRSFEHEKPSDNVVSIAAWHYNEHGLILLTNKLIQDTADAVGITVPKRSDITMKQASKDGKSLFQKSAKGFKLSVSGEQFVKEHYKVKKGNKPYENEAAK